MGLLLFLLLCKSSKSSRVTNSIGLKGVKSIGEQRNHISVARIHLDGLSPYKSTSNFLLLPRRIKRRPFGIRNVFPPDFARKLLLLRKNQEDPYAAYTRHYPTVPIQELWCWGCLLSTLKIKLQSWKPLVQQMHWQVSNYL